MNIAGAGKTLTLIRNLLDTTKSTLSPIEFKERKPLLKSDSRKFFEHVSPEECGIESQMIEEYVKALCADRSVGLQSVMIMRNDKVVFEATKKLQDEGYPKATFSECKSIVSLAIGILVSKGKLKLSERIVDIFADKASPVAKIVLKGLTVKHLLNMTSTVMFNEGEAMVTEDWIKGYLHSDIEGASGKKFKYNSLNTYILSAIVIERSGMSLSEFLDTYIFGELDIKDYYWEKCPMGYEKGGWGLYIRREDMAKIGLLVMQNGVWNGKQIVSERYINEATKAKVAVPEEYGDYDYGYHIWCGRDNNTFLFNGVFGQNLLGYKDSGIIILANCGNGDTFQQGNFFEITHKFFNRHFPDLIPFNNDAEKSLMQYCESIKSGNAFKKKGFLEPQRNLRDLDSDLTAIDGKEFVFSGNNAVSVGFCPLLLQLMQGNYTEGLTKVRFNKQKELLEILFSEKDEEHNLIIGFNDPHKSIIDFHGEIYTVFADGYFTENEDGIPTLVVNCDFVETPYSRICKFFFDSETPFAVFTEVPGNNIVKIADSVAGTIAPHLEKMGSVFNKFDSEFFDTKFEKAFSPKVNMIEITE